MTRSARSPRSSDRLGGDTPETLKKVEGDLHGAVITAGVYPASSIKVAEAAKVIENTQRDSTSR